MTTETTLLYALLGGILPAIFWLWFWLKEDEHPEPRLFLILTFISGMVAVPLVLPFQIYTHNLLAGIPGTTVLAFILWASIEEILKFFGAYIAVLKRKVVDEPVDVVIYMITAALGFVALENTLYLVTALSDGNISDFLVTGNLRFLGSSLIHVLSSATVGVFMAMTFYKPRHTRFMATAIGLVVGIALHSVFNLLIINKTGSGIMVIFTGVWLSMIVLMLLFEKIKTIIPQK